MHGIVIGKFYPPHLGHLLVVDAARAASATVEVVVCSKPDQHPSGELRQQWLQELYPALTVHILDVSGLDVHNPKDWATAFRGIITKPDLYFTSESGTAEQYAALLDCTPVVVDAARTKVPVSATQIRQDPHKYLKFLPANVAAYYGHATH
jgi:HTH-type transcriptional repressor of NAD biosynthesis genes